MEPSKGILLIVLSVLLLHVPTTFAAVGVISSNTNVVIIAGTGKTNPEIPIVPATGQLGPLSIDAVSTINFASIEIGKKGTAQVPQGEVLGIQVTDTRGLGAGWNVMVKISEFQNLKKDRMLKADISIPAGKVESQKSGIMDAPTANSVILNEFDSPIFSAPKGKGMGTFTSSFEGDGKQVIITVPPGALTDSYSANLSWTLQDAPS
ncbi:WxL domain-containing protein [Carnobacterium maltaromaticum]|uniref:WxL domain-containing protein n=1 Tax=Carnobacterium maltaromaticum TaxID=2751 RepID=A0AAW9K064_CARML|nr:WxL domain-containing protein [Carnobacterium maltaromaticum]MDZ5759270.1 WxL domain-containing protein [Carnobacterium maltaromaticum]